MRGVGVVDVMGSPQHAGVRMSADEYFASADDGLRYEVVDGLVLLKPSRSVAHQSLLGEILFQLDSVVRETKAGVAVSAVDVRFSSQTVYCPDISYFTADRAGGIDEWPAISPDLIVEVLSPGTEPMDLSTKRDDYERFGVREYLAIGPDSARHFVLENSRYIDKPVTADKITSVVIPGFTLDLAEARRGLSLD